MATNFPTDKVVVFRFVGGPRDGDEARSDVLITATAIPGEARAYWGISKEGEIGQRLPAISQHDLHRLNAEARGGPVVDDWRTHNYEVVSRIDTPTEIVITCEYCESESRTP